MKDIPCVQCPSLAICRHRTTIECELLWKTNFLSHEEIFAQAVKVLPRLEAISSHGLYVQATAPHYYTKKEMM